MRSIFFVVLTCAMMFQVKAQMPDKITIEEALHAYDRSAMIYYGSKYEIDGVEYPAGVFTEKLKRELKKVDPAFEMYRKYRRKTWLGIAVGATVIPAGFIASAVLLNPGPLVPAFAAYAAIIVLGIEANKDFQRAIYLYNREQLRNELMEE